jgi:hypothetical protein
VGYARQQAAAKEQAEKAEWEVLEKGQTNAELEQEKQAPSEVRISDLAWESEDGRINEVIQVSAKAELPVEMEHLTRFAFTLFSISGNSKERIDGKDAHWKNGSVTTEFTLFQPSQSSPKQPGHYQLDNRNGIVFFKDYWQRSNETGTHTRSGDHIDLWKDRTLAGTGYVGSIWRTTLGQGIPGIWSDLKLSSQVLFWEIP